MTNVHGYVEMYHIYGYHWRWTKYRESNIGDGQGVISDEFINGDIGDKNLSY